HLKRFEYDPYRDDLAKLNDRFEFPTELDMSPWLSKHAAAAASKPSSSAEAHEAGAGAGPFPSSEQQRSPGDNSSNGDGRNMYSLRAIVMHVGGPSVGHYYAYVRQMTAQRRG
ncbi:unnamed protein product, partial [Sphacelaria rigidula]